MRPGNTYSVSFWITNGNVVNCPWTIRNIGIHFSALPLHQSTFEIIPVLPQCEIMSQIVLTNWSQFTFTIIPATKLNYVTIGSFRNDSANHPTLSFPSQGGNSSAYGNYFIDDVKVIPVKIVSDVNSIESNILNLQIFPNPATEYLQVIPGSSNFSNLKIFNSMGKLLASFEANELKQNDYMINLSKFPRGLYILQAEGNGVGGSFKFIKD
jgi:hypothetical protein